MALLCHRVHLSRHIENQGLRQKLVRELQGLVELAYGDQQVHPDVLENEYMERVLLLRKVRAVAELCATVLQAEELFPPQHSPLPCQLCSLSPGSHKLPEESGIE